MVLPTDIVRWVSSSTSTLWSAPLVSVLLLPKSVLGFVMIFVEPDTPVLSVYPAKYLSSMNPITCYFPKPVYVNLTSLGDVEYESVSSGMLLPLTVESSVNFSLPMPCLLYTSDAADDLLCVD